MTETYIHNSYEKEIIRLKWVDHIKSKYGSKISDGSISIITLPGEACQDIKLFADKGIIKSEDTETGSILITKGNVVCFEKTTNLFIKIRNKLAGNCRVEQGEIGRYFQLHYKKILDGKASIFPVDVINLDFDKNVSKNDTDIEKILDLIFQFQEKHKTSISIFITFPQDNPSSDDESFKSKLKDEIKRNLNDTKNPGFKTKFESYHHKIDSMEYRDFLVVGVNKLCVKHAAFRHFTLTDYYYHAYGGNERHKMISLLLSFDYDASAPNLYYQDAMKCLDRIKTV